MTTSTDIKHIVRDPNIYGGKPCVEGHRIAVHDIAVAHHQGYSPDDMVRELFTSLTLPQVYAALLYYYEHKDEIDREIAEEAADMKARAAADMSPLAQKVRAAIKDRKQQLGL